ncbi:Helix-turn-helix domain-containing protein [Cohnella sp. OV330]|uniref:helix-turn-helix domain-containing protein n=1 Tax=Cohnella sp. OV330 TaxID=1855288 RepID=UPI0008E2037D|nr:helix-turn-helix domain-containing protein [Cohnella sp. OV330]SFA74331.1 Helix-turn-helix domain-containing protein [Cohnella sp. OV330]
MRKRFLRFWPRNLLLSWVLSYLLMLCIPIAVSFAFYNNAYGVIKSEIMRANLGLLRQAQQDVDGHLQEIRQLSTQLAFHAEEQGLMYWEQPLTANQRYMLASAQATFRTYAASGSFIDSFMLYLPRSQYVLTNRAAYGDPKQLHQELYGSTGLTFKAWQDLMNDRYTGQFMHLNQAGGTVASQTEPMVSFMRSLPLSNPTSTMATVVVSVKESKLLDTIRAVQAVNKGTVLILDAERRPIASTGRIEPDELSKILEAFAPFGDAAGSTQLDRGGTVMNRIVSATTEWQYVSVIPSSTFWVKAERIRAWSLAGLAFCLLLGGLFAYVLARRQYHPVGEILRLLSGKARQAMERHRDEYHFIREALRDSFDESAHMQRQLQQQSSVMRSNLLFRLLKGRLESAYPIDEALAAYDLSFPRDSFAAVIFYIEDFSDLFRSTGGEDEEKRLKFVQHIVRNIVEELTNKTYVGYMTDLEDNMMTLLVNVPGDGDSAEQVGSRILEMATEAQSFIASRFYIDHTVSVSAVHAGIPGIRAAYTEALDTLEYKMVFGTNRVIAYEQLQEPDPIQTYYYPMDKEQHLINAVKTGNFEKAMDTLGELFEVNMAMKAVPIDVSRCFMFDLVGTIMKTLDEIQLADKRQFMRSWDPITRLLKRETLQDMKREMESLLRQACEWVDENKKSRNTGLRDRVYQYIQEHYRNSNLSLAGIAEDIGVNSAYLSRFFKEQHGESLLDTLSRIRLDHAKRLLRDGGHTVSEIATMVGFYNSNAFIRTFKKYEGVTPGQYKEI